MCWEERLTVSFLISDRRFSVFHIFYLQLHLLRAHYVWQPLETENVRRIGWPNGESKKNLLAVVVCYRISLRRLVVFPNASLRKASISWQRLAVDCYHVSWRQQLTISESSFIQSTSLPEIVAERSEFVYYLKKRINTNFLVSKNSEINERHLIIKVSVTRNFCSCKRQTISLERINDDCGCNCVMLHCLAGIQTVCSRHRRWFTGQRTTLTNSSISALVSNSWCSENGITSLFSVPSAQWRFRALYD